MDARQMFLLRHERMHVRVAALTEGLTEEQVRTLVHPGANPLAWLLWHMARVEDSSINLLIGEGRQVLDATWLSRLGIERRDVGVGMTMREVLDLCARIDLAVLAGYWTAVGEQTTRVVRRLSAQDLDEVVSDERIARAVQGDGMVEGPTGKRLQEFWSGMKKGYFLVYLPLTHIYEHIGQADLLRGLLGRPSPF
jgi:hypothetical protein